MKRLVFAVVTVALILTGLLVDTESPQTARLSIATEVARPAPAPSDLPAPIMLDADVDAQMVQRSSWQVRFETQSTLGPNEGPAGHLTGRWHFEPLGDGRAKVWLSQAQTDGHFLMPPGDTFEQHAEVAAGPDGALSAMGFGPSMPAPARRMLTTLATTFWLTPGQDDSWVVEEEDGSGRYVARYTRTAANTIERTIERYVAIRGEAGLDSSEADKLTTTGQTRFRFDQRGLVEVRADWRSTWDTGEESPTIHARMTTHFQRLDTQTVVRGVPQLDILPISGHLDYRELSDQQAVAQLGDDDAQSLLAEVQRVAGLDRAHPDTTKWRHKTIERLTALVRIQPEAAAELARAIEAAGEDMDQAGLLIGALASADTAVANDTLADLLDRDLGSAANRNVIDHLSLSKAPSARTVEALQNAVNTEHGDAASTALGAQARQLEDSQPDLAEDIVERLLERFYAAETLAEQIVLVRALGNTGDARIAPAVLINARHHDATMANAATFALRFVAGEEVDAVLLSILHAPTTQLEAGLRAIGWRDAATWTPHLQEARENYSDSPKMVEAIDGILAGWGQAG